MEGKTASLIRYIVLFFYFCDDSDFFAIIMSLNIYERTEFKNIYVLPPMADDGLEIGSAILTAIDLGEDVGWLKNFEMPYFGDSYSRDEVKKELDNFDNIHTQIVHFCLQICHNIPNSWT